MELDDVRAVIAAIKKLNEDAENIAGKAYQVVGALAAAGRLFERPEGQRALDYFSQGGSGEILR